MTELPPASRIGPYEVVGLLGAGGMSDVYHARDTRLQRDVALKVLPARAQGDVARNQQLAREARIVSRLTHPHIRAIHDATEFGDTTVIVMEFLDGETLEHRLARRPIALSQAIIYAEQLASALVAAHAEGIIHHDIKPSNVMLTKRGAVLLDFGIATHLEPSTETGSDQGTVTESEYIPGTTAYMAPEQLEGQLNDPRSDLFSLGVLIYEMISGRKPFDGPARARLIAAILEHDPPPLTAPADEVPRALEHIVMKCLAKDPRDRWQTARDLASELSWFAHAPAPALPQRSTFRRLPVVLAAGVLALATLLIVVFRPGDDTQAMPSTGPVRFLAGAPINSVITVSAGAFTISPNGRMLAFTASSGGGPRLLWVRSLDSFDARPLNGTDGAGFPFWSPDSSAIGFFANGQLKTVEVDRSPVRVVADIGSAEWGAWNQHGDIIYTRSARGLFRVRASGGAPTPVLSKVLKPSFRFGGPEFLPDGDHFLLGVADTERPQGVSIYVGSLAADDAVPLIDADSQAIYAHPGFILYHAGGNLIAHPFNATTRQLTGEPMTLPEPVAFVRAQRRASFSVSQNGVIAYRQGIRTTQLTWVDRSGRRLGMAGTPARYVNPALAPDGQRIAVTRLAPSTTESDIWIFEPRGERLLTSGSSMKDYAVWSPDGTRIAYSADPTGFMDLFVKDAGASAEEPGEVLLNTQSRKLATDWTTDGENLVFLDSVGGVFPRIPMALPMRSPYGHAGKHSVTPDAGAPSEYQVQVSPSGRFMAYVSEVSGSAQVYVREFPNGKRRWQISIDGGFEPKWRGDGRELYYIAADQQMMAVTVNDDAVFSIGRPTPLFRTEILGAPFQNGVIRNEYAVTRDGQRFLINSPIDGPAAYAIRVVLNWRELLKTGAR